MVAGSAATRKARTDERLLAATMDLLRTSGVRAVTIEAVAAHSGIAKTTIYRRFADRMELLKAALDHTLPEPTLPQESDPRLGLTHALADMVHTIEQHIGTSLAEMVAAEDAPAALMVRDRVLLPRWRLIAAALQRWQAAGAVRADLDVELTVASALGAVGVTYADRGHFPPGWPERYVEYLWPLLEPPPTE